MSFPLCLLRREVSDKDIRFYEDMLLLEMWLIRIQGNEWAALENSSRYVCISSRVTSVVAKVYGKMHLRYPLSHIGQLGYLSTQFITHNAYLAYRSLHIGFA